MTEGSSAPPQTRYGQRRAPLPSRRRAAILAAVVGVVGVILAGIGYQRLGRSDVEGTLAGYQLIDSQTVSVTISVTRKDPSRPVDCIVRVRAKDGSETGRREVLVGPSPQATVQVTTVLKSSKPPVVGDIYGCGTDVPGYLRAP
ncbi:DUF4307 domain-containing protein [Candidatus Mycobacterium wuenschmannii]|uniref:DUF4307 domain-containing protein n=1 Tax=Candidatus Mycobacterium wuenschmannii TaxID=3027808 RepID=A0ABY8W2E5_9MYCO|nr:DUF4307 domain-containing protein [Candidatus Mycobacterium wuenschmannii]WIM90058.1 DUF4307 domain-containing protein [Candidatus Mycobacterium wuenschmannii]